MTEKVCDMECIYGERDVLMHIASLLCVAKADGVIRDEEKSYIMKVAASYAGLCVGKSFDEIVEHSEPINLTDVEKWQQSLSEHPKEARNLIKDMVSLGFADKDFCNHEREAVAEVASRLNVPDTTVKNIETSLVFLTQATLRLQSIIEDGCLNADIEGSGKCQS